MIDWKPPLTIRRNMGWKSDYRTRAILLPLGVLAYVGIALAPPPRGSLEIFPFFNWSLFSSTSDHRQDVVAIVRSIDGKPLAKPTLFYDLKDRFVSAATRDARLFKTLDRLAYGIATGNATIERSTRQLVEQHYMREARSLEYEVAVISYRPLERYHNGTIDRVRVLRSYTKHD